MYIVIFDPMLQQMSILKREYLYLTYNTRVYIASSNIIEQLVYLYTLILMFSDITASGII